MSEKTRELGKVLRYMTDRGVKVKINSEEHKLESNSGSHSVSCAIATMISMVLTHRLIYLHDFSYTKNNGFQSVPSVKNILAPKETV